VVAEGSPTSIGPDNTLHNSVIWPARAHIWRPQSAPVRRNDFQIGRCDEQRRGPPACYLECGDSAYHHWRDRGKWLRGANNTNMALACISEVRLLRE
jgi:hypothetical protein